MEDPWINTLKFFCNSILLSFRSENNSEVIDDIDENLDQNSSSKALEETNDGTKIQKTSKTQVEVN